jgi:putative PIN family toxin of toxin-antitoxin system
MGKKKKVKKVVLDTNILVSALLFSGELSKIIALWEKGHITPVISRETFEEFKKVLAYPKFSLSGQEIMAIIEEHILPFFEVVEITSRVRDVCRDTDDEKFISCAITAGADFIVSGDKDLCNVRSYESVDIIAAADLIKMFE